MFEILTQTSTHNTEQQIFTLLSEKSQVWLGLGIVYWIAILMCVVLGVYYIWKKHLFAHVQEDDDAQSSKGKAIFYRLILVLSIAWVPALMYIIAAILQAALPHTCMYAVDCVSSILKCTPSFPSLAAA